MKRLTVPAVLLMAVIILAVIIPPAQGIVITGTFIDDDLHVFEADIEAIAQVGITKGCNPPENTRFCPDDEVSRGEMAAFIRRSLNLPPASNDFFTDDENSTFEADIDAIAAAGITRGCNPPANTQFCPNESVSRGEMAAFLRRAHALPNSTRDHFTDDDDSTFEADIDAIAETDITKGCNPPDNTHYCPREDVSRGEMAAFLRRAEDLPYVIRSIPVGFHDAMTCAKDGGECSLTVDVRAGRQYRIREGLFQVTPATEQERTQLANSVFTLTVDGSSVALTALPEQTGGGLRERLWQRTLSFSGGSHRLVARWTWNGQPMQTNTITINAVD